MPPAGRPLAGTVIALDPGHNGGNWAAAATINQPVNVITEWKPCDTTGTQTEAGYTEHAFAFNVAMRLARLLRAEGATVVLTRTNDHGVGPCITQRAAIGNRAHANAAISIHADGGPPAGSGFDVIEPGLVPGHTNGILAPSHRLGLDIRNAYHRVTGEPDANSPARLSSLGDLRRGFDRGELKLHSLPKGFRADGGTGGMEALVRWRHPGRGLIMPAEFIPVTEQSYLMRDLTAYVLDAALTQAARWRLDGLGVQVSVNLSARDLLDVGLSDMVGRGLRTHGGRPGDLMLEVNERVLAGEPPHATATAAGPAAPGVPPRRASPPAYRPCPSRSSAFLTRLRR